MTEPVFLDVEDVLLIHEEQLPRYGGAAGVRDRALLESAVAMARATVGGQFAHPDLFSMAAAYAFHVAQNQPFLDGNKRTGLLAALVFLDLNGVVVQDHEGELYDAMIAVAERRLDKAGLSNPAGRRGLGPCDAGSSGCAVHPPCNCPGYLPELEVVAGEPSPRC